MSRNETWAVEIRNNLLTQMDLQSQTKVDFLKCARFADMCRYVGKQLDCQPSAGNPPLLTFLLSEFKRKFSTLERAEKSSLGLQDKLASQITCSDLRSIGLYGKAHSQILDDNLRAIYSKNQLDGVLQKASD